MDLPIEAYYILIPVIFIALAMALVSYLTGRSGNFRSSRNSKARRQD